MPTYVSPTTGNPYNTGVTGGYIPGDAATGHTIRYIAEVVEALEPWDTPLLTKVQSAATKKTANQLKIESLTRRQRPHTTVLNGNYTATGTSLDFGTTNISLLGKGMVLLIDSELFWTTADPNVSAGTIAVAFAQGGTTNANHSAGATVRIVGKASTLNGPSYTTAPVIYGDFAFNYPQRFESMLEFDDMARVTPDHEISGDKLAERISEEAKNLKILLDEALHYGKRQIGTLSSGAERPALMGGIPQFLTTNVTTITPTRALSIYDIETASASVWATYRRMATTLVMSMNTKRAFNRLVNPYRQATFMDSTLRAKLDSVELETGTFDVMVDPFMPDGEIWGLDFNSGSWDWFTYKDHDWQVRDTSNPQKLSEAKAVVGAFSMLMPKEPLMFKITGFSTNLSDYPVGTL